MNKCVFCAAALLSAVSFFSCVSKPAVETAADVPETVPEKAAVSDSEDLISPAAGVESAASPSVQTAPAAQIEPEAAKTPVIAPLSAESPAEPVFTTAAFLSQLKQTLGRGSVTEALSLFDSVPDTHKENVTLNLVQASLYISAGRHAEAEKIGLKLENAEPENIDVLLLNSLIAKAKGDAVRKNTLLQKIIAKDPKNSDAYVQLGHDHMLKRNFSLARKQYAQAKENDPENLEALLGFGQSSYYLGSLDDARVSFVRMTEIDPRDSMAWSFLGKLAAEDENYLAAVAHVTKAIENEPDYADFWIDYGSYSRQLERMDEAEKAWSKAIDLNPSNFLAYVYRASLYEERGNVKGALEDYRKVVSLNPDYYYAYESLGMASWHEKDWDGARAAFIKAYEIQKNNMSYPLMISATYLAQGNLKDNKAFLDKILRNMDRASLEYAMLRLYLDGIQPGAVEQKIRKETNRSLKGKMLYYLGQFYDIYGSREAALRYYLEVKDMQTPMFFEYTLNEWALREGVSGALAQTADSDKIKQPLN